MRGLAVGLLLLCGCAVFSHGSWCHSQYGCGDSQALRQDQYDCDIQAKTANPIQVSPNINQGLANATVGGYQQGVDAGRCMRLRGWQYVKTGQSQPVAAVNGIVNDYPTVGTPEQEIQKRINMCKEYKPDNVSGCMEKMGYRLDGTTWHLE